MRHGLAYGTSGPPIWFGLPFRIIMLQNLHEVALASSATVSREALTALFTRYTGD
jgi:hypothetical protein